MTYTLQENLKYNTVTAFSVLCFLWITSFPFWYAHGILKLPLQEVLKNNQRVYMVVVHYKTYARFRKHYTRELHFNITR